MRGFNYARNLVASLQSCGPPRSEDTDTNWVQKCYEQWPNSLWNNEKRLLPLVILGTQKGSHIRYIWYIIKDAEEYLQDNQLPKACNIERLSERVFMD